MFCSQCGKPLPEDAKFCQSCGTPVFETASDSTLVLQKNSELDVQEEVPTQMVGTFYSGLLNLSNSLASNFCATGIATYKTLDAFVHRGEDDIEDLFFQVDQYFKNFLQQNNIYQYDESHLEEYTEDCRTDWYDVFQEAVSACQKITEELNQEREYRAARKAGRGRVVGGGFGFSGAVKGMATAGAMNMGAGMLHSIANGLGNAMSEAKASSAKDDFFKNQSFWDELQFAIITDCYAMAEGFTELWDSLSLGHFPFYSLDNFFQAQTIQSSIQEQQVPETQLEHALLEMLQLYPVNQELYIFAVKTFPQGKENFFSMAFDYNIDLYAWENHRRSLAQQCATTLAASPRYCVDYDEISYDLMDTIEFMAEIYEDDISSNFIIFSNKYVKEKGSLLDTAQRSFASYKNTHEIPVCFYMPHGNAKEGIFLTNQKLYAHEGHRVKIYTLDTPHTIDLVDDDSGPHIEIDDDLRLSTDPYNANQLVPHLQFFAAYCAFLCANQDFSSANLLQDVLQYTGLSCAALSERASYESYDSYEESDVEGDVKYCSECGAINEIDANFCSECGADLD